MSEPATDKQLDLMDKMRIEYSPNISKYEARKLIENHFSKGKPKDITRSYSRGEQGISPRSTGLPDKDTLIVRQSCLKAAIGEFGTKDFTDEQIQKVKKNAEEFEKWVFRE